VPVVFAREVLTYDLIREMIPLVIEHFSEVIRYKDYKIEPDFASYMARQEAGILKVFTARNDGKLIAYSFVNLCGHPHSKSTKQAHEELLFLDPAERRGSLGARFIEYCDSELVADGANVIYHSVSTERDYSHLLLRNGYELSEMVYSRRI
jgi:hypothetical protein